MQCWSKAVSALVYVLSKCLCEEGHTVRLGSRGTERWREMWKVSQEISGKEQTSLEIWFQDCLKCQKKCPWYYLPHTLSQLLSLVDTGSCMGMWWVRSSHWSIWKLFLYGFSGVSFQCWHQGKIWESWEFGRLVWGPWLCTSTGREIILLDTWVPALSLVLPLLEHEGSLRASFESSVWIFYFSCSQENILSFIGTLWTIEPSNVLPIWKKVQCQNQVNSHLAVKVQSKREWVGSGRDWQLGR